MPRHLLSTSLLVLGLIQMTSGVDATDGRRERPSPSPGSEVAPGGPTAELIALLSTPRQPFYWDYHDITAFWKEIERLIEEGADVASGFRHGVNVWKFAFLRNSRCDQVGIPPDGPPGHRERSAWYGWKHHVALERDCVLRFRQLQQDHIAFLIHHGVDVGTGARLSTEGNPINTILRSAIRERYCNIVELLLKSGADPNERYDNGGSPLHDVVAVGERCLLCALLRGGARADVHDDDGETPLHLAARVGTVDVVRALLDYGAPVAAVDNQGRTAVQLISRAHQRQVRRVLLQAQRSQVDVASRMTCAGEKSRRQ